jgi:penicillin-binding protein 1B
MAIELTSVSGRVSRIPDLCRRAWIAFGTRPFTRRRLVMMCSAVLVLVTAATATVTLLQSYTYYSNIIDARLKNGYLTSRPGVYAAPRSISVGQTLTHDDLIMTLRRAGYAEGTASDVWSGSFKAEGNSIEIRPSHVEVLGPTVVRVTLIAREASGARIDQGDKREVIAELTGDGITLANFTLEPEALTNDQFTKNGQRAQLTFHELPPVLVQAVLSIEDHRFFTHRGLDLFGVGRALLRNVGDDHIGQGGSTITQQLVKNTYLSPERTYRRKFAEAMLAFALERRLSKEDIFALYCNEVYLGQRGVAAVRGVEQAARIYFGKDAKDLSVAEAATIAGMIQGPTRYSPDRHPDAAQARRNTVLGTMVRDGWLSLEKAQSAAGEPLLLAPRQNNSESLGPYFIDYVNRVADARGETAIDSESGRRIYTSIDLELQRMAEAAIKKQLDRLDQTYKNRDAKPQAALVALDPHTGAVLAMVGGRDYAKSQLNRATDARRQPGSTFKPFVYAAALEAGMSPVQMFADAPREFIYDQNKVYRPANFGGGFSLRDVTMRTGLVKSLNVVTVDVALQTGLARIANLAEQFGLPKPERYPALALGTTEVTPLQLAAAYAAFVRGGKRLEPQPITSVGAPPAGHAPEDPNESTQAIKPTTAYMITNMLAAVIEHGTARAARDAVKGVATAGKTGTSRDGWFVGYTPNLVCVVWIGFDDNQQLGLTGAEAALPAWTDFVSSAVGLRPELGGRNFLCPEGIKFLEIDAEDGLISTLSCPQRELIAVTETLAPNAECYRHGNLRHTVAEDEPAPVSAQGPPAKTIPRSPAQSSNGPPYNPLISTRVDVDARGRRTLVNEIR